MLHKKRSLSKSAELNRRFKILEKHVMQVGKRVAVRTSKMTNVGEIRMLLNQEFNDAMAAAEAEIDETK